MGNVAKELAALWHKCSDTNKAKYLAKADKDKQRYLAESVLMISKKTKNKKQKTKTKKNKNQIKMYNIVLYIILYKCKKYFIR